MPIGIPLESRMSTSMRPVVPEGDQVLMIMLMIVSMLVFMLVSIGTVRTL